MAQGIGHPNPNPVRVKGEQALIDNADAVIAALDSKKSLFEVAKELGIVTDKDTEAAIIKSISPADQEVVRAAVLEELRKGKGNRPQYTCNVENPADHVSKGKGLKAQASGNTINFTAT